MFPLAIASYHGRDQGGDVQANQRDGKKDQDSGRNRARTRWLCIREKSHGKSVRD